MFGGDVPSMDAWTRGLLTNTAVLEIDQHSIANEVALKRGDVRVWTAQSMSGLGYASLTNLGDVPARVDVSWAELGMQAVKGNATELWTGKAHRANRGLQVTLSPHASALYSVQLAKWGYGGG